MTERQKEMKILGLAVALRIDWQTWNGGNFERGSRKELRNVVGLHLTEKQ